jgi:hypothetical protein
VLYIFVADVCGGYEIIHMSFTSRLLVMLCFNVNMFVGAECGPDTNQ